MKSPENDSFYQELLEQMRKIMHKRNRYTLWKNVTRVILLLFGALITIISGWNSSMDDNLNVLFSGWETPSGNIILVLSAVVTLMTAMEALFKYGDKSSTYGIMLFEFQSLKRRMCYDFEQSPELFRNNRDSYFDMYQEIQNSQKELIIDSQSE